MIRVEVRRGDRRLETNRRWVIRNMRMFSNEITPEILEGAVLATASRIWKDARALAPFDTGLTRSNIRLEPYAQRKTAGNPFPKQGWRVVMRSTDVGFPKGGRDWYPKFQELGAPKRRVFGGPVVPLYPVRFMQKAMWRNRKLLPALVGRALGRAIQEIHVRGRRRTRL